MPSNFDWSSAYAEMKVQHERARATGDTYAVRAYAAAFDAIDALVMDKYRLHCTTFTGRSVHEPVAARSALYLRAIKAAVVPAPSGQENAPLNTLNAINALSQHRYCELILRAFDFQALPRDDANGDSAFHCDPEGLYCWLGHEKDLRRSIMVRALDRNDYSAAAAARFQYNYFLFLRRKSIDADDPWMHSRAMLERSRKNGRQAEYRQLRAAHGRLVLAMADRQLQSTAKGLGAPVGPVDSSENHARASALVPAVKLNEPALGSEASASSGSVRDVPSGFKWSIACSELKMRCEQAETRGNATAARAYSMAIEAIDNKVMARYRSCSSQQSSPAVVKPEEAYRLLSLQWLTRPVSPIAGRGGASSPAIDSINQFTLQKLYDLAGRDIENAASSAAPPCLSTPGSSQAPATPRPLIIHQLTEGQPLSGEQAAELNYRASMADSLGRLGARGYRIMRDMPVHLAQLSGAARPPTGGAPAAGTVDLEEFDWMLSEIENARCL